MKIRVTATLVGAAMLITGLVLPREGLHADDLSGSTSSCNPAADLTRGVEEPTSSFVERMNWQYQMDPVVEMLSKRLPGRTGEHWIDNATSQIVINTLGAYSSEDAAIVDDVATICGIRGGVRLNSIPNGLDVRAPLEFLNAAAVELNRGTQKITWNVDSQHQMVRVQGGNRTAWTVGQRTLMSKAEETFPNILISAQEPVRGTVTACDPGAFGAYCDFATQGGVRFYEPAISPCTTAFAAKSRINNVFFVMTAGHCMGSVGDYFTYNTGGSGERVIGPRHNYNYGSGDWGIIRAEGSFVSQFVFVRAGSGYGGELAPSRDEQYTVTATGGSAINARVCYSGQAGGAKCGKIENVGQSIVYSDGTVVTGLGVAGFCVSGGDSGSPVFANRKALGIMSGRTNGTCRALYVSATTAQNDMNVAILYG